MLYIDYNEILQRDRSFNADAVGWLFNAVVHLPGYKRGQSAFERSKAMANAQRDFFMSEMQVNM